MDNQTLVIWFKDGMTAYFEHVTDYTEFSTSLCFTYHSLSSDKTREATFMLNNLAGYALEMLGE